MGGLRYPPFIADFVHRIEAAVHVMVANPGAGLHWVTLGVH